MIKSISTDQNEILKNIRDLHCGGKFDCDCTYGNGSFYKDIEKPLLCFDKEPLHPNVIEADSTKLPIKDESINSLVFDPPFLTYISKDRTGNGNMIMARRFSGYWTYGELETHYRNTIDEAKRVLNKKGIFVVKVQDIVHNHRLHSTHHNFIDWAENHGFRLKDLFILNATHRLPSPNRKGKQQHARVWHSFFLVFQKL